MNFKWFQNKLTFVIIPDANGSVLRVKLSRGTVWGAIALGFFLIGASGYVYWRHMHMAASTFLQSNELSGKTARLEQTLTSKNRKIEELQNEIYSLSRQAAEVNSRVEEMKKLEQDLHKLAPDAVKPNNEDGSAAAAAPAVLGMGGPAVPVTHEEVVRLAAATSSTYKGLQSEVNRLALRLSDSKRELLAKQERIARTPNLWPTVSRIVTSPYGYRKDPFTKKLSFHKGIDIAGKMNDPIYAAAAGIVQTVGYDKLHGHNVIIEHSQGLRTWYMHLNGASVREGDTVGKGQPIGQLGSTGRSTGPHLHYEVQLGGKSTDPGPYLPFDRMIKGKSTS